MGFSALNSFGKSFEFNKKVVRNVAIPSSDGIVAEEVADPVQQDTQEDLQDFLEDSHVSSFEQRQFEYERQMELQYNLMQRAMLRTNPTRLLDVVPPTAPQLTLEELPMYWASTTRYIRNIFFDSGIIPRRSNAELEKYLFELRWDDNQNKWVNPDGSVAISGQSSGLKGVLIRESGKMRNVIQGKSQAFSANNIQHIYVKILQANREGLITDDHFSEIKQRYENMYSVINDNSLWYSHHEQSPTESLETEVWDIILTKFSNFLNFPVTRQVLHRRIFPGSNILIKGSSVIFTEYIHRIFYILSVIEDLDSIHVTEEIPILKEYSSEDVKALVDDIIEAIILKIFTTTYHTPIDGSHGQGKSYYLTEFLLFYYTYYAIFKEKGSKRRLIMEDVQNYVSSAMNKMWKSIDDKSILYRRQGYNNLKTNLEKIKNPYSERALWFLENVYGPNREIFRHREDSPYDSKFRINPSFIIKSLPKELYELLMFEKSVNGIKFPVPISPGYTRISTFGGKLTSSGQDIKLLEDITGTAFDSGYTKDFIKRAGVKVTLASDPKVKAMIDNFRNNPQANVPVSVKLISLADNSLPSDIRHDVNVKKALQLKEVICIELPIFDPDSKALTGHIDIFVQQIDDHLVVWDYKPEWGRKKWSLILILNRHRISFSLYLKCLLTQ